MFLPNGGFIQLYGGIQGMLFLEISLTENWLIFVTRGSNTLPSWQLVAAIFGVDVLATLFCVFGWLTGGIGFPSDPATQAKTLSVNGDTDIITVVVIWCYSICVTIIIAIVYALLNKWSWLNNLGRAKRSREDTKMENILGHLSKIAMEHERDEKTGISRYQLVPKAADAEEDD